MKSITVNGERFISEDALVKAMVKECVRYTDTNEISVDEYEAGRVAAFQGMLQTELPDVPTTLQKFKEMYVSERFIKRTLGV